ncbi:MAG: Abi family protein [Clostridiaceae bacterium]|nr:Abi family protein [Clostridiaceae bacterium]
MEKFFAVPSERIKILRDRNMNIGNSSEEKELLKKYNYYNLINAYKDPFLYQGASTKEKYKNGTQLKELEALLKFDTNLRLLFLREILKIEEIIKNQLVQSFYAYHLSSKSNNSEIECANLHRDSEYLRRKYYDLTPLYTVHHNNDYGIMHTTISATHPGGQCTSLDRQSTYDNYITTVYRTLGQQRKKKNDSIKSYLEQHGYMPMWILMNVLTFGNVSHLFTLQKKDVQVDIIKSLNLHTVPVTPYDLSIINTSRILQILSIYRNICAHNERFYITKVKVPIDDNYMYFGKKLPHAVNPSLRKRLNAAQKKKRLRARQGIYVLIFIISLFMDKKDLNDFVFEIRNEFKKLECQLSTISIDEIERFMGLNFDWYNLIKG